MARRRARLPLDVYMNARLVGHLNLQSSGAISFQYNPDWLSWDHALPVSLSLPLREDPYAGDPVIPVFDNLLPDSDAVRRLMAERVKADGHDVYSLLAKVGRDCVGALQFLPEGSEPAPVGVVKSRIVDEDYIAQKIENLTATPLGIDGDEAFRLSLAGVQEKTALLYWRKRWRIPLSTTATSHILKPQIGPLENGLDLSQSVENEYLCMKLTAAFGLPTASVDIADFKGKRVLVVERFDRLRTSDNRLLRLPQEDFCQALSVPPTLKYQTDGGPAIIDVLHLLQGSDDPETDRRKFLKAQIMFWLLGATDGHGKNFSIFLEPGGRFHLTPLYDVMSLQPDFDAGRLQKNKMKLAMSVGDNRHYVLHEITIRHFIQTAIKGGAPKQVVPEICDQLIETEDEAIEHVLGNLPADFPNKIAKSIIGGLQARMKTLRAARRPA